MASPSNPFYLLPYLVYSCSGRGVYMLDDEEEEEMGPVQMEEEEGHGQLIEVGRYRVVGTYVSCPPPRPNSYTDEMTHDNANE